MARRRVLFLAHGHARERPGGAENYAHRLHVNLRSHPRWEPVFLARSGPPQSRSPRSAAGGRIAPFDGVPDEYLLFTDGYDFDWVHGTMRHDKRVLTEHLRRFLRAAKPDVVHVQHTLFVGYDAIREMRRTLPDVPIVMTLHEFLPICHHKGQMVRTVGGALCEEETPRRCSECFPDIAPDAFSLRKQFIQAQLRLVDLFVAPSRIVRDRFIAWGIAPERILLEDYGQPLRSLPSSKRRPPHRTFGFFGQLTEFKGIDVLLRAFALAARGVGGDPAPVLHVHGANLDLQERRFRERVAALLEDCPAGVTCFGPYDPQRVGELMNAVDWVVVPSIWWENSPLVIQEAFSQGRPVICSDIGGMSEKVTHERDGLLFRVGDAHALASVLQRAVTSDRLWERLRGGVSPVHSMDAHIAVLTGAYDRLLAARRMERAV
jgi:glycosyltransferase involved in cell wall biosynthesis